MRPQDVCSAVRATSTENPGCPVAVSMISAERGSSGCGGLAQASALVAAGSASIAASAIVRRNTLPGMSFRPSWRETDLSGGGEWRDRKSVGEGKSVSVSVNLGGRRLIKKKNHHVQTTKNEH